MKNVWKYILLYLILPGVVLFCDGRVSFDDMVGFWNMGTATPDGEIQDFDGTVYYANSASKKIYKFKGDYFIDIDKVLSIKGEFPKFEIVLSHPLDPKNENSITFTVFFHLLNWNTFWVELDQNSFNEKKSNIVNNIFFTKEKIIFYKAKVKRVKKE